MSEHRLYKTVARFVESEFGCFAVQTTKGTSYGSIDVLGLRYNVGDLGGTSEVVAVEVKPENATFLKSLGQAVAYTVMADRCYLALHKPYHRTTLQEQREMAAQLRVGLIEIGARKQCRVVVSSPRHQPIRSHKLSLINRLGYVECVICGTLFPRKAGMRSQRDRSGLAHAIRDGKPLRYWLRELNQQREGDRAYIHDRRYLCKDCVNVFSSLAPAGFEPKA
jgi:hypothetical protein